MLTVEKSTLFLDLGSTYTKCALLRDGNVVREKRLPSPDRKKGGYRWEVDGNQILAQCLELISELRDRDTSSLLISTQMHGCILTDGNGKPVSPYYSWQDRIGTVHLSEIQDFLGKEATTPSGVPIINTS